MIRLRAQSHWALLALYAAVLLSMLSLTPLWLDEVLQLGSTRDHRSFRQLIDWVMVNPGASPLPYLLQKWLVDLAGLSRFAARLPAALSSIACGAVFWKILGRLKCPNRLLGLALFLAVPLQFRYGVEGRVYSLGLLFSLLTLWVFLKLYEAPSLRLGLLYGALVLLGLYSQPLSLFPVLGQALYALSNRGARRLVIPAVAIAAVAYLPWYVVQRRIQAQLVPAFGFSLHQVRPLILLHDLAGDGYACSIPLVLLAAIAVWSTPQKRLWLYTLGASIAGPIFMDALVDYFFAERQLLFALPALVILAAQPRVPRLLNYALLSIFFGAAAVNDYRLGTIPRDDLSATADAIVAQLHPDACLYAASREAGFYIFFRPELKPRVCPEPLTSPEVLAVIDIYTRPLEKPKLLDTLSRSYERESSISAGQNQLLMYRRR